MREVLIGVVFAICTGCFDGSLMAPFSFFERSPELLSMTHEEIALSYLGSFSLAIPVVALPPLFLALFVQSKFARQSTSAGQEKLTERIVDDWKDLRRAA